MKIIELFKKSINRNIQGVIQVDQNDTRSLHLELEEYVVTDEVKKHLQKFFESMNYSSSTPTEKVGVWISGFFGSGKSHLLKILALMLENKEIEGRKPYEYLEGKLQDELLIAEISKAAHEKNKVILFNIGLKANANSSTEQDAIVNVLMKVFNNALGYCGEIPWLANFERGLEQKGLYDSFVKEFETEAGGNWVKIRENFFLEEEKICSAFAKIQGISIDQARSNLNDAKDSYYLDIDRFVEIVKGYVEKTNERVIFFIDEIGQYIGDNSPLMLELATVAEDFGRKLQGKAWLVVTSQEAVDRVIKVKGDDFSRIKGRFATQLILTSGNTDTVIKKRLLEKKDEIRDELAELYINNESTLKNLISFSSDTSEMKFYSDEKDFIDTYPFIPFQIKLVQKVFEKIRVMGATGAHLADGERSLLSAFQEALNRNEDKEVGILVPFSTFYSSIENSLTGGTRRTFISAETNSRLEDFDIEVLEVLFMIKYLDVLKPNLENLKTLFIQSIDEDKISLGEKLKESLQRLEGQNFIHKSGEDWIFLTDEEQDINKEIKNIEPDPIEIIDYLHEVVFSDIYPNSKYSYPDRNKDFSFLKFIDGKQSGALSGDISLHIFTPYSDEYGQAKEKVTLAYSDATACLVLPNVHDYLEAIKEKLQIQKYINKTSSQTFSESLQRIRNDKVAEKTRLERDIKIMVEEVVSRSDIYINGSPFTLNTSNPKRLFDETLLELIKRTYSKLDYVDSPFTNETLDRILSANDFETSDMFGNETNRNAIDEVYKRIEQNNQINKKTLLSELKKFFTSRPFGWSEIDISGILLVLLVKGMITMTHNGEIVTRKNSNLVSLLTNNRESDKITFNLKEQLDQSRIENINKFASSYFDNFDPTSDEDILVERLKEGFNKDLSIWKSFYNLYNTRNYPNKELVNNIIESLQGILKEREVSSFLTSIESYIDFTKENNESMSNLLSFFTGNQKEIFDNAYEKFNMYSKERIVEILPDLEEPLNRVQDILKKESPFSEIKELNSLLHEINEGYQKLVSKKKEEGLNRINNYLKDVEKEIPSKIEGDIQRQILFPLISLLKSIESTETWTEVNSSYSLIEDSYTKSLNQLNNITKAIISTEKAQKTIKPVKINELVHRDKGLETEKDVDEYVGELGNKLKDEIKKGNTIKIL